ncbi:DUF354 domain-containing protein [Thermophagus sp. OGC60D27]|uniref:DUF354 domain-containing protein n=1 Tax=Thermophagus sp. OGC60D27 TaxID=3458415 RepID=UPI0040384B02
MRIMIDIGHPAHVHYFRNFIRIMETRGHQFLVTARSREHVTELLRHYDIPFEDRGIGGTSLMGKIFYLLVTVWKQYRRALKFKPDLFLDFSTIYSGPAAWLTRKPYITFTDTENTKLYRRFIDPFCKVVYTPECFPSHLGKHHRRFNGVMELAYLHPKYFEPDPAVLEALNLKPGDRFAILRFVDWKALHDRGKAGFPEHRKMELVKSLERFGKVLISSEGALPNELESHRLRIDPAKMHHLLFYATLLVGEGATMTTEAALLGTPAIYLSDFRLANLLYLENNYGLVLNFGTSEKEQSMALNSAEMLFGRSGTKNNAAAQSGKFLDDHIDVTGFMVDAIENMKL